MSGPCMWKQTSRFQRNISCVCLQRSIDMQSRVTLAQLATPVFYWPIIISVGMRFLQQMTGITPTLVYLELIFSQTKVSLKPR